MKKTKKNYRAVIIGSGQIGALFESEPKREKPASHAGAVVANKRTELVAFVEMNKKNLAAAQKLFPRVKGYASLVECLQTEHPDIAVIATPPSARLALIKECLRFNVRMIICEKPLAKSTREAEQIQKLIAKSGVTLVLNYQRRFSRLFARVRLSIKKGKLGRIQQVTCYYSNGLYNNGGHTINALEYLIDDKIVSAIGTRNVMNKTHPAGDLNVDALLTTRKGTTITLQSFDQKEYGIHDIRIYGTKGSVVFTDYGISLIETPARPSRFVGIQQLDSTRQHSWHRPLSATKNVLAHTIDSYENHTAPASSVANGLATLQVLDAVAKSAAHNGRQIPV